MLIGEYYYGLDIIVGFNPISHVLETQVFEMRTINTHFSSLNVGPSSTDLDETAGIKNWHITSPSSLIVAGNPFVEDQWHWIRIVYNPSNAYPFTYYYAINSITEPTVWVNFDPGRTDLQFFSLKAHFSSRDLNVSTAAFWEILPTMATCVMVGEKLFS